MNNHKHLLRLPRPVERRRFIVQFIQDKDSTIVLPDSAIEAGGCIRVLKVGPEVTYCKPGDNVLLFPDSPGGVVLDGNQKIVLIHESNIMAVEENE